EVRFDLHHARLAQARGVGPSGSLPVVVRVVILLVLLSAARADPWAMMVTVIIVAVIIMGMAMMIVPPVFLERLDRNVVATAAADGAHY
ncbi:MAG: hypothetical protein AAFR16_13590, partial [Pseudomonadota bacterium]